MQASPMLKLNLALCLSFAQAGVSLAASPAASFTLVTGARVASDGQYFIGGHKHHCFLGSGGDIDGQPNPTLRVKRGTLVEIVLLNQDQRGHRAQLAIPELSLATPVLVEYGDAAPLSFTADRTGTFTYTGLLTLDGRNQHIHMRGKIVVTEE